MAKKDDITVTFSRTEALALYRVADIGITVAKALGLIQNTTAAENAATTLLGATRTR